MLLIDPRDRRYLITLASGKQFHSHLGIVEHDNLIGGYEGSTVRTSGGSKFLAFRPTLAEYTLKMKRGAQVVYPKDVGLILVYADIGPGATVVEAGTGSASLTLALARAVGWEAPLILAAPVVSPSSVSGSASTYRDGLRVSSGSMILVSSRTATALAAPSQAPSRASVRQPIGLASDPD